MCVNKENYNDTNYLEKENVVYQILTIHRSGLAIDSRPRIQIVGDWLNDFGFVNGALVQVLPETNGIVFNLCNENINYSELYHSTKKQSGTLIRIYVSNERTKQGTVLVTTGSHLIKGGLGLGDALIAKCEYGRIRVRKVCGNVRLINVARTKHARTNEPIPMVFLLGDWLNDIGFAPDTLITIGAEPGCLIIESHNESIIYSEVVKYARKHKMQLRQVSRKDGTTLITHTGKRIITAGFNMGDIFAAEYEYGIIKLKHFEPERFGFPVA